MAPSDAYIRLSSVDDYADLVQGSVKGKPTTFNLVFVKRFSCLQGIVYGGVCSYTTGLLFVLLTMAVIEQFVAYQVGVIPSKMYKVLNDADREGFAHLVLLSLSIVSGVSLVMSLKEFIGGRLAIEARRRLTDHLHKTCLKGLRHYTITVAHPLADNIDQRIVRDTDQFSSIYGQVLSDAIVLPFTIGWYTWKTWLVTGWLGPCSVLGYFIMGAVANRFLMSRITSLVYTQERKEGDFRYSQARLRMHAESVGFMRSAESERHRLDDRFHSLLDTQTSVVNRVFILHGSTHWLDYFGSILSYFVVAIPVFTGSFAQMGPSDLSATISKYTFESMYLINCFSKILDLSEKLSLLAGYTHRIGELIEVSDDLDTNEDLPHIKRGSCDPDSDVLARVSNLTYRTPMSNHVLARGLDFVVRKGENLLVAGPTGCGKTSLLRVMSGLWFPETGQVNLRQKSHIYVLPQKPFLPSGSLRSLVIYPKMNSEATVEQIREVLDWAGLQSVVDRVGGIDCQLDNWYEQLSPGETQRLSFARLFYHKPAFAVLDEATSSVEEAAEANLYFHCSRLAITLVSVGHRSTLIKMHQKVLTLDGKGGWKLSNANEATTLSE